MGIFMSQIAIFSTYCHEAYLYKQENQIFIEKTLIQTIIITLRHLNSKLVLEKVIKCQIYSNYVLV